MRVAPALFAAVLAIAVAGCQDATAPSPLLSAGPSVNAMDGHGQVIQHASVGSNDLCLALGLKPGCDANFSLVANKYADGTVQGQWEDEFGKDENGNQLGGVHVSVNCLVAEAYVVGTHSWPIA